MRRQRRSPVARHALGAWDGGGTALVGLLALVVHLALFALVFSLRYVAIPLAMLGLRLAQAMLQVLYDELSGNRARRGYARRRHVRWV
jgi:hypothetical protein